MLSNIGRKGLLLHGKSILFRRYNAPQIALNVRGQRNMVSSKDQSAATEDDNDEPIKYSTSKAAAMRIDEYRMPYGDSIPWYQPYIISLSLTVFLGYFCILREENDIDLLLETNLETSLSRGQKEFTEKESAKSKPKLDVDRKATSELL